MGPLVPLFLLIQPGRTCATSILDTIIVKNPLPSRWRRAKCGPVDMVTKWGATVDPTKVCHQSGRPASRQTETPRASD
jgi:hypothetical protein